MPDDGYADPLTTDWTGQVPAHVSAVDGAVRLEREGRVEAVDENVILLAGDRLTTDRGRAEVLFGDGSVLAIDEYASVDLLDDALMRLAGGRVRLTIARATGGVDYRVDTVAGSAFITTPGEYRLALYDGRQAPEFDVAVLRGTAELANERGRTLVRAGTHAATTAEAAPSLPYAFNVAAIDAFDRWAEDQAAARLGYDSARYLPTEIGYYSGAFDRYGSWAYEPTYGYVWYPRVATGWRPYTQGRWTFVARFGWTWIGVGGWSWPTHHYGRWGLAGDRWFWIPERRWAPAWVSWASAPGYVGWCPLGFDNRPVISITHVTVRTIDPWRGWTVAPSHAFRSSVAVSRYAVPGRSLSTSVATRFADHVAPGAPTTYARAAAIRSPGARGTAVPRGSAAGARATLGSPRATAGAGRDLRAGGSAAPQGLPAGRASQGRGLSSPGAQPDATGRAIPRGSSSTIAPDRTLSSPARGGTYGARSAAPTVAATYGARRAAPTGGATYGARAAVPSRNGASAPSRSSAAPTPVPSRPVFDGGRQDSSATAPSRAVPRSRAVLPSDTGSRASAPSTSRGAPSTSRTSPSSRSISPTRGVTPSRAQPSRVSPSNRGGATAPGRVAPSRSGGGGPAAAPRGGGSVSRPPAWSIAPSRSATPSRSIAPSRSATPSRSIAPSRSVAPSRAITPSRGSAPSRSVAPARSVPSRQAPARVAPRGGGSSSAPSRASGGGRSSSSSSRTGGTAVRRGRSGGGSGR
ncbi:MAG: DUF6600 domain-containing protein [Vicinamibacterales bacterium]